MSVKETLISIAAKRILILDGAMGSLIQSLHLTEADFRGERFASHQTNLLGCNDLLCLTKPQAISAIHEDYLAAGADITKTCSFNATAISLADYGLADYGLGALAYEISRAAAALARKAADAFSTPDKPRFVAGSIGPTAKTASLSPDVDDPAKRGIYWDELEAAYYENARGLADGGADIFLVETIYDTLNAKAALFAIDRVLAERRAGIPLIISATVSGDSGRLLSGQTIDAFCASALHAGPWAIGLNCSFGAEKLLPHVRALAAAAPCLVSAHPNAGLPNQLGSYDETPQTMAALIEPYLREGLVNIVGGCCGSTPAHIKAIAETAAAARPRPVPGKKPVSVLSGLELLRIGKRGEVSPPAANPAGSPLPPSAGGSPATPPEFAPAPYHLTIIGERANVAGSKQFLRLISEENYGEALALVRNMIESGAEIVNIGMDDAMLDAKKAMAAFLDHALADPEIARVPCMIDSSRWDVIELGLKRLQGKGLVNSITLKEGETEFLRRASLVRRYGAAVVVMLIDEQGQAVSYERKIEIAARAYQLLCGAGFPAQDIVFDPNILAIATGISEHNTCAVDFIRACSWIRDNCPGAQISGGVSNLSFSFRGNNTVRNAMHSVFLHHAAAAGLSMAIVNPSSLIAYNNIEANLRAVVEDVILNRQPDAADRLLTLAEQIAAVGGGGAGSPNANTPSNEWRSQSAGERIIHAMIKGLDDYIEADVLELRDSGKPPLAIVEGPLMDGMKEVGNRFGEGKMYLPQVIRSARVMKKAVAALAPYMERRDSASRADAVLLATVKGDVHDIGKNIVGVVLACNGCAIIDLGVMVPAEQIVETAERENAAIIGLSGLISPSLDEMVNVARQMEKRRMNIPLLIGGAAASLIHTALRIAPEYSGPVVYVPDAGKSAETVRSLLSPSACTPFLAALADSYREAIDRHKAIQSRLELLPIKAARANRFPPGEYRPVPPKTTGLIDLNNYPLKRVIPYIDWQGFLHSWEISSGEAGVGEAGASDTLLDDAKAMLDCIQREGLLRLKGTAGIFPAAADGDDIIVGNGGSGRRNSESHSRRFCFLRSQAKKSGGVWNPCLADFLAPSGDWLGLFALSAGFGAEAAAAEYRRLNDDYRAALLSTVANALTEAFTEEIHLRIRREWWGCAPDESLSIQDILKGKYAGIRPAFGYPACPDHQDKRAAFDLLQAPERSGFALTESAMIIPAASICGMIFANPAAYYFSVGPVGEDQARDAAERRRKGA
jgi:5-methyltetrahydrofolate--homocysteine methyltransferase